MNISSLRNKFQALIQNVSGEVDLLIFSETKIDESFPKTTFLIKDFSDPFRIDQNVHEGGTLLYVKKDVPTTLLSTQPLPSECCFVEVSFRKRMQLIIKSCSCNPHKNNISKHIEILSNNFDLYTSQYESNTVIGDFHVEIGNPHMNDFCHVYNFSSVI